MVDAFQAGDSFADVAGPLGNPSEFVRMSPEELKAQRVVFIAGGLGSHLNLISAARTGLIPPGLLARTEAVGNTAIEGAALALINPAARAALGDISAGCTYIELSGNGDFDARYVQAMNF